MIERTDAGDGLLEAGGQQRRGPEGGITLRSLSPEYVQQQHGGYLRHLIDAVKEPKNRNIALTGRYGSGKSSVLDAFEAENKGKTLRISINTLGPDGDDEDLTNRIQKELVKQLIYRAEPGKLRRSRFARNTPLTMKRAFFQALGITIVGLALLWLLGVRPGEAMFGTSTDLVPRIFFGTIFAALVVVVVWVARWLIGDRIVSQVATAGMEISLDEKPSTYFDEFLDEIMAFFDAVSPEFVIFEDLDRFDDPRIFDSLRELNTLINASAHSKDKRQPIRFIYAIKDSLFEQLGAEPATLDEKSDKSQVDGTPAESKTQPTDLAVAAVERANRTKFFELVIPMVPFISHRNARDHLVESFNRLGLAEDIVTRPLLDLVARHTTDMRMLINICNEFAVFAEHLLWIENPAPGMTADNIFALVAYKNFHLADFEAISQRGSSLDKLEQYHLDLVRASIEHWQKQKRELINTEVLRHDQNETASILGQRLLTLKDATTYQGGHPYEHFLVESEIYLPDEVSAPAFWNHVVKAGSISITRRQSNYAPLPIVLESEALTTLFPEGMNASRWRPPSDSELTKEKRRYDRDIAALRGADFSDLVRFERIAKNASPFKDQVARVLKSELARDLVYRGFITRNYAEYSAAFYGEFIGVDVAFFYNHSVQQNQMYLDYEFKTENAVRNLMEQVPADFMRSVSALNLQIASHLLTEYESGAKELVAFIIADFSPEAQTFLEAFLNVADGPREQLIELFAAHPWPAVYDYLASHDGIPDEAIRTKLFDTALLNGLSSVAYDLTEASRSLLNTKYADLEAFKQEQSPEQTDRIMSFARDAELIVTDLSLLAVPLRAQIVNEGMYELTARNLQTALGIQSEPSVDEVRKQDAVWDYCRENLDDYLAAFQSDFPSEYVVQTAAVLRDVILEQYESWTTDQLSKVLIASDPEAAIDDLTSVPTATWPTVMAAGRVTSTITNIWSYVEDYGVDEHLAAFLAPDDNVSVELRLSDWNEDNSTRVNLAIQILNASAHLPASTRVKLVSGLELSADDVAVINLVPAEDDLLTRALEAKLLPDTAATFTHFAQIGWKAVKDAFAVSSNIQQFLSPELVTGFVAELLASNQVPDDLRTKVVSELLSYVPGNDPDALKAAGVYARDRRITLAFEDVRRIALTTHDAPVVFYQLVRARNATSDELIEVLDLLGMPYSKLASGPGQEIELPSGSSSNTLFTRLETMGKVKIVRNGLRGGKMVRSLV